MSMSTELQTERHGSTLVLRLNGPTTRNALSAQVMAAGVETLNMAEANPDVRAVVLTGANGHFCSGGDGLLGPAQPLDVFHPWIEALHCFPKPVIAAVEGVAAGRGVSLALACDLIVAADNARFVLGNDQQEHPSDDGISWHLQRALGRQRALALLWLARSQPAHEWHRIGLVHALAANEQTLDEALALSARLAERPAAALTLLKEQLNEAEQPLRDHLATERQRFARRPRD